MNLITKNSIINHSVCVLVIKLPFATARNYKHLDNRTGEHKRISHVLTGLMASLKLCIF